METDPHMEQSLYPGLKNAALFLEVVDERNTPLCVMAEKDVLRQRLRHRAVALLIRDSAGRALLTFRAGRGWGFSSFAFVAVSSRNPVKGLYCLAIFFSPFDFFA